MATVGHLVVGLAVGRAYNRGWPAMLALSVMAESPDVDFFLFGHGSVSPFAHRGVTHSFFAAALVGVVAAGVARLLRAGPLRTGLFFAFATATHGIVDSFTSRGSPVVLFWPFSDERIMLPRFIPVASFWSLPVLVKSGLGELLVFSPLLVYALWPRRSARAR